MRHLKGRMGGERKEEGRGPGLSARLAPATTESVVHLAHLALRLQQ